MKTALLVLGLAIGFAYSSVVPIKGERKLADATFLTKQKQVLDLYFGLGYSDNWQNEYSDFDLLTQTDLWDKSGVIDQFVKTYKQGYLPKQQIFTLSCHHTKKQTIDLFDILFFAKDFESFYKVASWARKNINPTQFAYVYTVALLHREDCQGLTLPPLYEIMPTYFVPQDTMHQIYDAKIQGKKDLKLAYNNTGYEYNYHQYVFGGPLGYDAYAPHLEYKVSYFREDVALNSYYTLWKLRYPGWMCPQKYNKSSWYKKGEGFYFTLQQLFARYSLERLANGLPYVEPLLWDGPIKTGYNPRVSYINGQPMYVRPDNYMPGSASKFLVNKAKKYESRIMEAVDEGLFWYNESSIPINTDDGIDQLGKVIYGSYDKPTKGYYGSYYHKALDALGYLVQTGSDKSFIGGALSAYATTLRDPVYYNFLNRILYIFQSFKKNLPSYTQKELAFPGVAVKGFEVDKLTTYFEMFDYEVTNGVPVKDFKEYSTHNYQVSQYRLNHKPFTYKVTVNSDNAYEGIVRIFLGPKYDSQEHILTLEQQRLLLVEIDRFPVKLAAGENVFERNSRESPVFIGDSEGFRHLYSRVSNAIKSQEPFYVNERVTCGAPERFQLPKGWKQGQPFVFYVVVSPFEKKWEDQSGKFSLTCGSAKLYDYRPLGYPFDKPIHQGAFGVPNIYSVEVPIYHKGEFDINRVDQQ